MQISGKVIGRSLLILLFSYFTVRLLFYSNPWIFIDHANLLIHETGHLIFLPFGQFIHMLGGSFLQLFVPVAFFTYFILKRDLFASSAALFWVANNLINVAHYMNDAQGMQLPLLVEGSIHDWNWIFTELGILDYSGLIGGTFFYLGAIIAILSVSAMVVITFIDS